MDENKSSSEKQHEIDRSASPLNLNDLLKSFCRFWWVCLVCAVLFAGAAFYRNYVRYTPKYRSSVTFTVQTQGTSQQGGGLTSYSFSFNRSTASQLAQTFPSIIRSNILQDIICNDMGLTHFPCTLSASAVSGTNMFTITAEGTDPIQTYDVLQSVIRNYPDVAEYVIGNTRLNILDEPSVPEAPFNQFAYRSLILHGACIGFLIGLVWIFIYTLARKTIRTRDDIRKELNQHCLGILPEISFKKHSQDINRSVTILNPRVGDGYLESVRGLRNSVLHDLKDDRVILVSSTAPGEGKTAVSLNLALSIAKMNHRVLIVDGDLRNPSIMRTLGIAETALKSGSDPRAPRVRQVQFSDSAALSVMTFSTEHRNVWDFARTSYLTPLFRQIRQNFDYIIVDTSPVGVTSEPCVFAQVVDAAIMVVRQDGVHTPAILNALDSLLSSNVRLLGCVLNGAQAGFGHYGSQYGYHYGRYGYGYGRYGYGRYGYGQYGYGYGYGESNTESESKEKSAPKSNSGSRKQERTDS